MSKKLTGIICCSILAALLVCLLIIGRNTIGNLISGKVHFPDELVGETIRMKDGQDFIVFRRLKVDGQIEEPDNLTVFQVRFKFRNLGNNANKRLSIIPAPFLMGMDGFREKIWAINEKTNDFLGIYQWSSKEAADNYPASFIFRLMTKRAAPGTVSYEIFQHTDISQLITAKRRE